MITEPVKGWRVWGWKDGLLQSPIFVQSWPPLERFEAVCRDSTKPACEHTPAVGCMCGVHLAATQEVAVTNMWAIDLFVTRYPLIWGLCSGWGRTVEHTRGYRTEFAY